MSDNEAYFDDEAEQEQEDKFEDSSLEDEDEEDRFEKDDFLVDDEYEEDEDDVPPLRRTRGNDEDDVTDKRKKKKRRRYREDSPELAEGDLQLLEEKGVRIEKKRLKRLRKRASDEEDNADLDDLRELAEEEDDDRYEERRRRADEPVDYDDDMDDFIDDGGRGRRRRAAEREGLVSSEAVRQARNIFGDVEDMTQYRGVDKLFTSKEGQGDDEEDADYDPDTAEGERPLRKIRDRDTDRLDDEDGLVPEPSSSQQETIPMQLSTPLDSTEEKRVVSTDIPEQLQYHFGPDHRTPTEAQLREEGAWIYERGFKTKPLFQDYDLFDPEKVTNKIVVVLSYIHIDKLDIPFIAMYRKDYITPYLIPPAGERFRKVPTREDYESPDVMGHPKGFNSFEYDDYRPGLSFEHQRGVPRGYDDGFGDWSTLWLILDLDKRYTTMLKRCQNILDATKKAAEKGVPPTVVSDVESVVRACEEERRLKDAERYLQLAVDLADVFSKNSNSLSQFVEEAEEGRGKRPSRRKNRYADFCKRGYRSLAEEFGLTARQFGENVRGGSEYAMQLNVPLDADDEPIEVARVYADRLGESAERAGITQDKLAERLLSAARFILVTEIVADMSVLQTARMLLCKPGSVSVTTIPTRQGIAQVDDSHPMRRVTNLFERKIESFKNSPDFALALRAVELEFTRLEIVFQPEQRDALQNLLRSSFVVAGVNSTMVELWNEQRRLVVEEVFLALINQIKDEVKEDLTLQTNAVLRSRLCQAASRRLLLGPARPSSNLLDNGCPRVLAVCVTAEDDEDLDPLQAAKDFEEARAKGQMIADRRIAHERITFVELDENGEYQTGYELFAQWLRRPTRPDLPQSQLSKEVKEQLIAFISQSRAQVITIGIGSGGRAAVRLQADFIDIITEMICAPPNDDDERPRRPLNLSQDTIEDIQRLKRKEEEQRRDHDARRADETSREIQVILSKFVILADEFPGRIYAKTDAALVGLSVDAMTLLEKRTIGLGRLAQEPLWVYCAIGQEEEAALHLKLHPYHYIARPKDRLISLQRALFRAVCSNGVDINRMLRLPHTQTMLAYVGGLGVHKGKALLRALESSLSEEDRGLMSRKHLWSENYLGRTVFLSTAGFLRVRDPDLHVGGSSRRAVEARRVKLNRKSRGRRRDEDGNILFDPMDDSRIHPEHYAIAIKIADEALRDDDGKLRLDINDSDEYDESLRMTAAVLDDPSGLQRLALDEYADHLEKLGRGSLFETVKVIASEFQGPYRDHRVALASPQAPAVFYLVTGADPLLVRVGSLVTATDSRLRQRRGQNDGLRSITGITCSLPHDIRGNIPMDQFADDDSLNDDEIRQLVPEGSSLTCRIRGFEYLRFEAILTSKTSLIKDAREIPGYIPLVDTSDPSYRPYPRLDPQEINASRLLAGHESDELVPRSNPRLKVTMASLRSNAKPVISHPLFREIAGQDAIGMLRTMLPGDIIIRPSQYDKNGIIFSCKFAKLPGMDTEITPRGVFHKDCQMEYDPENESVPLRFTLDDSVYEYIDQVLDLYLRPIISNLTECLDHRKFMEGSEKNIETAVSNQKRANPKAIPYQFGLSERSPTSLVLIYIPGRTTVEKEEIKVVPDGYQLRGVLHKNMNVLFTWFKGNMRKRPSTRRPTAMESAASPFRPYSSVASPFHRPPASPFHGARSPFSAPKSPFSAPKSPFSGGVSARPAEDAPPPPAPLSLSNMADPYSRPRREVHPQMPFSSGVGRETITAEEWSKATLTRDEPPPRGEMQNGSYDRAKVPEPRGFPPRVPPAPRGPPSPRRRDEDMRENGRGAPMRGGPPPRGARSPPPRNAPPRGAPPRGAPSRGPLPRGPPSRESLGGAENGMPAWRGAKPVPAWKKLEEAKQQAQQQQ